MALYEQGGLSGINRKDYNRIMKNTFLILAFLGFLSVGKSQLVIGKEEATNDQVSIEFDDTENRGMILPYVTDKSGITTEGSLIYDATDFKIKLLIGPNQWLDLTTYDAGAVDLSIQGPDKINQLDAKTMIGDHVATDTADGILVLSDSDKAMILPQVESPHLTIENPSAGLIVFDKINKQLAVFNGVVWSFWKP
jgi:hypothetical protein